MRGSSGSLPVRQRGVPTRFPSLAWRGRSPAAEGALMLQGGGHGAPGELPLVETRASRSLLGTI